MFSAAKVSLAVRQSHQKEPRGLRTRSFVIIIGTDCLVCDVPVCNFAEQGLASAVACARYCLRVRGQGWGAGRFGRGVGWGMGEGLGVCDGRDFGYKMYVWKATASKVPWLISFLVWVLCWM